MTSKTILFDEHIKAGGKIVDFAGWQMPIHYGSQIEEHKQVREDAGMFDVSHMVVVDLQGENTKAFLQFLLANDVAKLNAQGKALYSCMLNEKGGIIDDLIVYYFNDDFYRMVVNAATREKDLAWLEQHAQEFAVNVKERQDLAMIAIQGPNAIAKTTAALTPEQQQAITDLKPFVGVAAEDFWIARTGYTGEDGFEIILPENKASEFWQALLTQGVKPCGLGARDTLRLEAGLNLYGSDMDETVTPLESNLAWTVAWQPEERQFMGRSVLEQQKQHGIKYRLVGLILEERGVLRNHQKVRVDDIGAGEITSGSFSPTMGRAIAMARIPTGTEQQCYVEMRGKWLPAKIVKPPFVRKGKILI